MVDAWSLGVALSVCFGLLVVAAAVLPWWLTRGWSGEGGARRRGDTRLMLGFAGVGAQAVIWSCSAQVRVSAARLGEYGNAVWACDDYGGATASSGWSVFVGEAAHDCVARSPVAVALLVVAGLGVLLMQWWVVRSRAARWRGTSGVAGRTGGLWRVWRLAGGVARLACGLVVVLSVVFVASPPVAVDDFVSAQHVGVVAAGVERYQAVLDAQWSDPGLPQATDFEATKAEKRNWAVRDRLAKEGMAVASATSSVRIVGFSEPTIGDYGLVADVVVSTEFAYEAPGGGSVAGGTVTELHWMNLGLRGQVIDDEVRQASGVPQYRGNSWSDEELPRPRDVSEDCAPVESSAGHGPVPGGDDGSAGAGSDGPSGSGGGAVAAYAREWTSAPHDADLGPQGADPAYPAFTDGSAALVSQALRAGGWAEQRGGWAGGLVPGRTGVWSSDLVGPAGASRTWSVPAYQYAYVRCHAQGGGAYEPLDDVWRARPGDLLYLDWGGHSTYSGQDKDVAGEAIDTVMVVTGTMPWGEPRVSQKGPNRSDVPLRHVIALAQVDGRESMTWYGLARQEQE